MVCKLFKLQKSKVLHRNVTSFLILYVYIGSLLGPLLFLIYVNNVAKDMSRFCRLYADDNSLQNCSTNQHSLQLELNNDLNQLETLKNQSCAFK